MSEEGLEERAMSGIVGSIFIFVGCMGGRARDRGHGRVVIPDVVLLWVGLSYSRA